MNDDINQISLQYLNAFYENLLHSILDSKKKLVQNSVLLAILKLSSNDIFKIYTNSYITLNEASISDIGILVKKSLIRKSSDLNKPRDYVITIHGIYLIESLKNDLDLQKILTFIQNDRFDFSARHKPLTDNERAIIFSLIGIRAFSNDASMDLNSESYCNKWVEIISNKVCPFLYVEGSIAKEDIFPKKIGNEHPVSYLMRHANDLPKKSNNLFSSSKKNQYYLAIDNNDHDIAMNQISFLLEKIFERIDTFEDINNHKKFLQSLAHDEALYVIPKLDFVTFKWDEIINEALEQVFLGNI